MPPNAHLSVLLTEFVSIFSVNTKAVRTRGTESAAAPPVGKGKNSTTWQIENKKV